MKDLYVIGNGFDIHHRIPSSYKNFRTWLEDNDPDMLSRMDEVLGLCTDEWWNEFETNLGEVSAVRFFTENVASENEPDIMSEDFLKEGKYNRFNIQEEAERLLTQDYITDVIDDTDFDSGQRNYLPEYVEDPTVSNVNVPAIEDVVVRRLSDQTVLIEARAIVPVDLEFFVYKPDYYLFDEDSRPDIIESDWNDHYMWCSGTAEVSVNLSFRTSPKLGKVLTESVQVVDVEM